MLGHEREGSRASVHAELPYQANAARMARRLVGGLLAECGLPDDVVHDSELVAHELTMNAYQHGEPEARGSIELVCALHERSVLVSVHDGGTAGEVAPQPFSADAPGGRGLVMVEALCTSWTVDRSLGTRVTAHLDARVPAAAG